MIVTLSLRGHIVPLQRLSHELIARGHRVTFAVQEDGKEWVERIVGAKFISLGRLPMAQEERKDKLKQICHDSSFFRGLLTLFNDIYLPNSVPIYKSLLLNLKRDRPDLMVIDIGTLGALDAAQALGIPFVINSPTLLFNLDSLPHYIPAWGSGFSQHMTLWERCLSILFPRLLAVALTPTFMDLNHLRRERDLPVYRSQTEIFKNTLVMVNTVQGFDYPQPVSPLIKYTGALLPREPLEPLPASLLNWLDGGKDNKPVVLVLAGSGSMSHFDMWHLKNIMKGLTDPRLRVFWALPSEQRSILGTSPPASFRVKTNFNPLPVLAHPAIKAVLCPCGMALAQETLFYGKPLLCLPLLGDQIDVAARVVDAGAGLVLDKTQFDTTEVRQKIFALFMNASYEANARRVGSILRTAGGLSFAADIVEFALHPGTSHLLTPEKDALPWHQSAQLDVLAVIISLICILVVVIRAIWLIGFYLLCYFCSLKREKQ